jgi:flagellar biosynthesis/type III secretory pathway protein FliH
MKVSEMIKNYMEEMKANINNSIMAIKTNTENNIAEIKAIKARMSEDFTELEDIEMASTEIANMFTEVAENCADFAEENDMFISNLNTLVDNASYTDDITDKAYDEGYEKGFIDGKEEGIADTNAEMEEKLEKEWDKGYMEGKEEGYNEGYEDARNDYYQEEDISEPESNED